MIPPMAFDRIPSGSSGCGILESWLLSPVGIAICLIIWLVVWNTNFIFPYLGKNHPNWRTHIFQRCRHTTNQTCLFGYPKPQNVTISGWRKLLDSYNQPQLLKMTISHFRWVNHLQTWAFFGPVHSGSTFGGAGSWCQWNVNLGLCLPSMN